MSEPLDEVAALLADVVARLSSSDDEERYDALDELGALISESFDEDAAQVGSAVREGRGLCALTALIAGESKEVAVQAMEVLANLVSDTVDSAAWITKEALLQLPAGAASVLRCLSDEDEVLCMLAAGAVQNLCSSRDWCRVVVDQKALGQLDHLLNSEDERVRRYAAGALKNVIRAAHEDVESGGDEATWEEVWLSALALGAVQARAVEAAREAFAAARASRVIALAVASMCPAARAARIGRNAKRRERMGSAELDVEFDVEFDAEARVQDASQVRPGVALVGTLADWFSVRPAVHTLSFTRMCSPRRVRLTPPHRSIARLAPIDSH